MSTLVRKQLHLDAEVVRQLEQLVAAKGGRRRGYSLSREVTVALSDYVRRQTIAREEAVSAPVWQRLLDQKFDQMELWLRSGVWGGATYATTAALLLLELMCGKTIDPRQAKEHFELIRGRAWKIVRKDPGLMAQGLPPADD